MARVMPRESVKRLAVEHFPAYLRQRRHAQMLDTWAKGEQGREELSLPREHERSEEYNTLADRARSPWLPLVITSMAQTAFLEGARRPKSDDNLVAYDVWQRNEFDDKQSALYRGAMGHGLAYVVSLPARDRLTGEKSVLWKAKSAISMAAFFEEEDDEWPYLSIEADEQWIEDARGEFVEGFAVRIMDDKVTHFLTCVNDGEELQNWQYHDYEEHGSKVCPVVEYPNLTDLDGRRMGEVEPFIPLARRIDQTNFDRLIVQRYGAWKVRYITGLVRPKDISDEKYKAALRELKVGDFLVGDSKDTKFGQLDEMDLERLIKSGDADLRTLSAVTQTPPHHMLGLSSNMQAESLAAAEAGLTRKSVERKTTWGARHRRLFRLTAMQMGNAEEARAHDIQVRWRDMESRSLAQAADALGKLATQVGVPQEMLWERIPNWTDADTERAKRLVEAGAVDQLMAELAAQSQTRQPQPQPTA